MAETGIPPLLLFARNPPDITAGGCSLLVDGRREEDCSAGCGCSTASVCSTGDE
jgi:hypothetical protein